MGAASDRNLVELAKRKFRTTRNLAKHGVYSACQQSDFIWRYGPNLTARLRYKWKQAPLEAFHEPLLRALKRDGIVITSINELMGDMTLYDELARAVWQHERALAAELSQARANTDRPDHVKSYLIKLLGSRPTLDPSSVYARLALHPRVLGIANGYFGMLTRLRHYNVWHNFPTQAAPRESQLWHRDPEDRYVFKMFIYLTDVDEGSGPLTYASGTHAAGCVKTEAAASLYKEGWGALVLRSDDAQMSAVVPMEKWVTATGPKGTVVLVDTRGYHKGGLVRKNDRIVYVCTFTSIGSTLLEDVFGRKLPPLSDSDIATVFAISG
jgi:hypothetical protein